MNSSLRPDDKPACTDLPLLFESEKADDHTRAKALCDLCPVRSACQKLLEDTINTWGYGQHVGPRGTWAGRLYTEPRNDKRRKVAACGTRSGYQAHHDKNEPTCVPCRAAEAEYARARKAQKEAAA